MRWIRTLARILLGSVFFLYGLNGFFHFLPMPRMPLGASSFMALLVSFHYIYVIKAIEVTAGFLLLANRFIPLALTLLGPILINITLFHFFFDQRLLPLPFVLLGLWILLVSAKWSHFKGLVREASV